ncbi:MAG: hypothetical protein LBR42_02005 [Candidatus Methanoplasma sp.]|jgi:hypothetical protein|nr:hypothetical protein [Candidatus Methanoplasma sp.]
MTFDIIPLKDFMEKQPEEMIRETLSGFSCSKDKGVQRYLRETSMRHEDSHISRIYLIFESGNAKRLVAYITIAMKCLNLDNGQYDEALIKRMNVNNGIAQSYMIGQLGKVDGYDKKVGILLSNSHWMSSGKSTSSSDAEWSGWTAKMPL